MVPDDVKKKIRAVLLSQKGGVKVTNFQKDYHDLVREKLDHRKYGYSTMIDMLQSIKDVVAIQSDRTGVAILRAVNPDGIYMGLAGKNACRLGDSEAIGPRNVFITRKRKRLRTLRRSIRKKSSRRCQDSTGNGRASLNSSNEHARERVRVSSSRMGGAVVPRKHFNEELVQIFIGNILTCTYDEDVVEYLGQKHELFNFYRKDKDYCSTYAFVDIHVNHCLEFIELYHLKNFRGRPLTVAIAEKDKQRMKQEYDAVCRNDASLAAKLTQPTSYNSGYKSTHNTSYNTYKTPAPQHGTYDAVTSQRTQRFMYQLVIRNISKSANRHEIRELVPQCSSFTLSSSKTVTRILVAFAEYVNKATFEKDFNRLNGMKFYGHTLYCVKELRRQQGRDEYRYFEDHTLEPTKHSDCNFTGDEEQTYRKNNMPSVNSGGVTTLVGSSNKPSSSTSDTVPSLCDDDRSIISDMPSLHDDTYDMPALTTNNRMANAYGSMPDLVDDAGSVTSIPSLDEGCSVAPSIPSLVDDSTDSDIPPLVHGSSISSMPALDDASINCRIPPLTDNTAISNLPSFDSDTSASCIPTLIDGTGSSAMPSLVGNMDVTNKTPTNAPLLTNASEPTDNRKKLNLMPTMEDLQDPQLDDTAISSVSKYADMPSLESMQLHLPQSSMQTVLEDTVSRVIVRGYPRNTPVEHLLLIFNNNQCEVKGIEIRKSEAHIELVEEWMCPYASHKLNKAMLRGKQLTVLSDMRAKYLKNHKDLVEVWLYNFPEKTTKSELWRSYVIFTDAMGIELYNNFSLPKAKTSCVIGYRKVSEAMAAIERFNSAGQQFVAALASYTDAGDNCAAIRDDHEDDGPPQLGRFVSSTTSGCGNNEVACGDLTKHIDSSTLTPSTVSSTPAHSLTSQEEPRVQQHIDAQQQAVAAAAQQSTNIVHIERDTLPLKIVHKQPEAQLKTEHVQQGTQDNELSPVHTHYTARYAQAKPLKPNKATITTQTQQGSEHILNTQPHQSKATHIQQPDKATLTTLLNQKHTPHTDEHTPLLKAQLDKQTPHTLISTQTKPLATQIESVKQTQHTQQIEPLKQIQHTQTHNSPTHTRINKQTPATQACEQATLAKHPAALSMQQLRMEAQSKAIRTQEWAQDTTKQTVQHNKDAQPHLLTTRVTHLNISPQIHTVHQPINSLAHVKQPPCPSSTNTRTELAPRLRRQATNVKTRAQQISDQPNMHTTITRTVHTNTTHEQPAVMPLAVATTKTTLPSNGVSTEEKCVDSLEIDAICCECCKAGLAATRSGGYKVEDRVAQLQTLSKVYVTNVCEEGGIFWAVPWNEETATQYKIMLNDTVKPGMHKLYQPSNSMLCGVKHVSVKHENALLIYRGKLDPNHCSDASMQVFLVDMGQTYMVPRTRLVLLHHDMWTQPQFVLPFKSDTKVKARAGYYIKIKEQDSKVKKFPIPVVSVARQKKSVSASK